jgi:hypothetical protein
MRSLRYQSWLASVVHLVLIWQAALSEASGATSVTDSSDNSGNRDGTSSDDISNNTVI